MTRSAKVLPKKYLQCVGTISSEWAHTEKAFERLLWRLAGIDNIRAGMCVTTHLVAITRIEITKTLAQAFLKDPMKSSVLKIANDFDRIRIARNKIVHALWLKEPGVPHPITVDVTARAKLRVIIETHELAYMEQLCDQMSRLTDQILEIYPRAPHPAPLAFPEPLRQFLEPSLGRGPNQPKRRRSRQSTET